MEQTRLNKSNTSKNTMLIPQTDMIIDNYLQGYMKVFSELNNQIQDLKNRVDRLIAE